MKIENELVLNFTKDMGTMGDWETYKRFSMNKIVLELGTYSGLSAIFFSRFAKKVYTIDNYEKTPFDYEAVRNYLEQYGNIIAVKANSIDMASEIDDNFCDTLLIDADHSYDAVSADYEAYHSKIKKGGVLIFHDTDPSHIGSHEFVKNFIKRMDNNNPKFVLLDNKAKYETICKAFEKMY